jgi:hypothetical protein
MKAVAKNKSISHHEKNRSFNLKLIEYVSYNLKLIAFL